MSEFRKRVAEVVRELAIALSRSLNWDETGVHLLPTSCFTYADLGAKQVPVSNKDDKREITCVVRRVTPTTTGDLPRENRQMSSISDLSKRVGDIYHSETHWANAETCIRFTQVLLPYIDRIREEIGNPSQAALLIHDIYRSHQDEALLGLLKEHNCSVLFMPANLTSELQPNDQLVNKILAEYESFYTARFLEQLQGETPVQDISIDTRMVAIKNEHAKWLVAGFLELEQNECHCQILGVGRTYLPPRGREGKTGSSYGGIFIHSEYSLPILIPISLQILIPVDLTMTCNTDY